MVVIGITVLFLMLASLYDLKTGEIPEKITRGLIVVILIMAAIYSISSVNPSFLAQSLLMGVGFFIFGYLMFYLGEWGGGDVKLLAGVGCSIGFLNSVDHFAEMESIFPYYMDYFLNLMMVAVPYVIVYSFLLGLINPKVFAEFVNSLGRKRSLLAIALSFTPSLITLSIDMPKLAIMYLLVPPLVILALYLYAVEKIALQKTIDVQELKEEDILANDLIVDEKKIASRRNMEGVSKDQVAEIQRLASEGKIPRTITVRWGVRFAPILFFAFLLTVFLGGVLEISVRSLVTWLK
jgi:hypothetical protein